MTLCPHRLIKIRGILIPAGHHRLLVLEAVRGVFWRVEMEQEISLTDCRMWGREGCPTGSSLDSCSNHALGRPFHIKLYRTKPAGAYMDMDS